MIDQRFVIAASPEAAAKEAVLLTYSRAETAEAVASAKTEGETGHVIPVCVLYFADGEHVEHVEAAAKAVVVAYDRCDAILLRLAIDRLKAALEA